MANAAGKALLGLVAATFVAGPSLSAQDDKFREAVQAYRLGERDKALSLLSEVLRDNPSNEAAFELWKKVDQHVWLALISEGGEIGKIAQHLLQQARVGRKEMNRDADAIADLIGKATSGDYDQRRKATLSLISDHGQFAVPALIGKLGDDDDADGQIHAINVLVQMGRSATMPLVQALESDNAQTRRHAASALAMIRDERAAAALAKLAANGETEAERDIANRALAKLGITAGTTALDLFLRDARRYLDSANVQGADFSDVIWTSNDGAIAAVDVPPSIYNFELAKHAAHEALALDPNSDDAKTLLARAYLGEVAALRASRAANPDDEGLAAAAEQIPALRMVAAATGPAVVRRALDESVSAGMVPMAVAAIETLGEIENRDSLASSSLVAALDHEDKRVHYAAALALTKAAAGGQVPAAAKVVQNLGGAVAEEAVRRIHVVDNTAEAAKAVDEANAKRGMAVVRDASLVKAADSLLRFPDVDVVVINEILEDAVPETLIGLMRKDPRFENTAIVIKAKDVDAAAERFGDAVTSVIPTGLTGEKLIEAVNAALEGKELDNRRASAEQTAVAASNALRSLAAEKVDVTGALDSLVSQLNRGDDVSIPAAHAIGFGGGSGQTGALLDTIQSDEASLDLKVACADALGQIFSSGVTPQGDLMNGLRAVVGSDADTKLRMAVVRALGRASLSAEDKLQLLQSLKTIPSGGSAEG